LIELASFDHAVEYMLFIVKLKKCDNLGMGDKKISTYTFMLCRNSFLNVLNLGADRTKTLLDTRLDPGPNQHVNIGNHNAVMHDDT
jgi:hypothetical protein